MTFPIYHGWANGFCGSVEPTTYREPIARISTGRSVPVFDGRGRNVRRVALVGDRGGRGRVLDKTDHRGETMRGRKPPIAFQRETGVVELETVSKAAWVDVAVMLLHVVHENDSSVDLQNPIHVAGLLFAYARPILKARGDANPLAGDAFPFGALSDSVAIRDFANSFDAPAWDDRGGRG